jgi:hypothetical protein
VIQETKCGGPRPLLGGGPCHERGCYKDFGLAGGCKWRRGASLAVLALVLCLNGCALYPDLKSDQDFVKAVASEKKSLAGQPALDEVPLLYCSQDLNYAELCALVTDQEFTSLLGNAAGADRTLGYLFVGAAGAAAALAKGSAHANAIKNLAIATGTLVGVRSVAETDKQRQIAIAGRNALECLMEAAQLVGQPSQSVRALSSRVAQVTGRNQFLTDPMAAQIATIRNSDAQTVRPLAEAVSSAGEQYLSLAANLGRDVTVAAQNAPKELAVRVIRLRLSVRSQLASSIPSVDDIATTRLAAINSLMGEFQKQAQTLQVRLQVLQSLESRAGIPPDPTLNSLQVVVDSQTAAVQSLAERCGVAAPPPSS